MARQVLDFHASAGITSNQSNEHQRRWSERSWNVAIKGGNYDRTRERLNFEIAKGDVVQPIDKTKSIPQRIKETLAARGIVDPNEELKRKGKEPNRRTVVNIIFGGSREQMHRLAFGNQEVDLTHGADNSHITRCSDIEEWAKDVYKFACDKWGEENIAGFYVHLDEKNPHIHCTLLPITARNKFSFKELFAGKDKIEFKERTLQLHNELAVVNERWGLGRGRSIMETGARHRSTEEYRRELRQQCDALEIEIGDKHETLRELYADIRKAEKRCKGLSTMVGNLETKETELNAQLAQLEADLSSGAGDAAELRRRIADLEDKLRVTTSSLADKKLKLKNADRQLARLQSELQSVNEQKANAQTQYREFTADNQAQIRMRLTDAIFGKAVLDIRSLLSAMPPEQKAAFDDEFLMALSEKPTEILKCAMYLFAGYVDGAIQFAKGSGGGGSGSELPWGRDPNEDDRHFAYRCMMRAHRMLRPATKQVKR
ncbi:recombinase [Muribaculaceae bacterium Isolate-037 (Harlan)]|nr:recombinase [Muribaculaceae bacterium Isolate-037 (Harlan)]